MFCPQCGQQQVAEEVRFCSRCGFQLGAVGALLRSGGVAPERRFGRGEVNSPRRRGVRQGVMLAAFGVFLFLLLLFMHELKWVPDMVPMSAFLVIFGGLLRLVYALFEDAAPARGADSAEHYQAAPSFARSGGRAAPELPAAQGAEARSYVQPRMETADIASRPSVIEGTTRRLGDERDPAR